MSDDDLLTTADLVESIFQQMVGELARHDGVAGVDGTPPEDLLATTLGKRLAAMILEDRTAAPAGLPSLDPTLDSAYPAPVQDEQLVDRMLALAAALGACDCWGQDLGCPVCEGAGSPGWLPPDRHLFAAYVYPAMRAVRRAGDVPVTTEAKGVVTGKTATTTPPASGAPAPWGPSRRPIPACRHCRLGPLGATSAGPGTIPFSPPFLGP